MFFVPLGLRAWCAGHGIRRVIELDWWERAEHGRLAFHLVPVQHWSSRTPFDRDATLWGGWIVEHPAGAVAPHDLTRADAIASARESSFRFFFAGDTGYSPDFRDIAARFAPIDLAALPIGAYEPRWFMKSMHINPEEAVRIHQDLRARYSVAMHWGTFVLTDEPLDEPPHRLAAARRAAGIAEEHFFVMKHGETRSLQPLFAQRSHSRDARSGYLVEKCRERSNPGGRSGRPKLPSSWKPRIADRSDACNGQTPNDPAPAASPRPMRGADRQVASHRRRQRQRSSTSTR